MLRRPETGSFLGLAAVFGFFAFFGGSNFASIGGAASWLNVAAALGIIAIPIGVLMIAGELDISIGSLVPAGSMMVAIISGHFHMSILLGIGAALALGAFVGLINGLLVVRTAVPSFIVTLGTLFAAALLWGFLLHFTRFGNWIFAMGCDKVSARNAGVPTDRMTILLFLCSGASATFVGVSQAILYNSAQVSAVQSYIFDAIISVVVGGVLLTRGYGAVVGIILGTLTFGVVSQGIYCTGFDANWASLIIGVLLLLAVLMNNTFRKMALSYAPRKKGAKA